MNWTNWKNRLEKLAITLNLIGLGFGFSLLGILILAKRVDPGSCVSGVLGIVVGALFLSFAYYFCRRNETSNSGLAR
jgi:putative Mn2+ efflux pump MntP